MTDSISHGRLKALKLGRIAYVGLQLKLFDHYLCYEYFAIFIKTVEDCAFCLSICENIQWLSPKRVFPCLQMYVDI